MQALANKKSTNRGRGRGNVYPRTNANGSTSFVAQVRVNGYHPVAKSFSSKSDARAWAERLERELRKQSVHGSPAPGLPRLTVKQLAEAFLADPVTAKLRYKGSLDLLIAWWVNHYGAERVISFGVLKLREARLRLMPGRAPGTVNRYLSAMRAAWNWGRSAGLVPQEAVWPSRLLLTEPRGRSRYLTDDELGAVLQASEADPLAHAAIVLSLATGIRQGELLRLQWADVDFDRQRLRVLETKNGEARAVHLPAVAVGALKVLRRGSVVGQRQVFLDPKGKAINKDKLSALWKPVRTSAGLKDFRWHDLRHSCASFLAQKGATLLEIGSVLGHKSPSVTLRYAHLVQGAPVTGHAALDEKLRGKWP